MLDYLRIFSQKRNGQFNNAKNTFAFPLLPNHSCSMRHVAASIHYDSPAKCLRAVVGILLGDYRRFDRVQEYEREFAKMEGGTFAVASSLARTALWQILQALKLEPGDRILLSPVTIPEILAAVKILKLEPIYVDFAPDSLFPDLEDLKEKARQHQAKAFLLTIIAGQIGNMSELRKICNENNMAFLQDITQAGLCKFAGESMSHWADYSFFSTCELKFIHCYRGAMICTNSQSRDQEIRAIVELTMNPQQTIRLAKKWLLDTLLAISLAPFFYTRITSL
jgi:dTDP-4-amino-4,6-dideoxygalactose transaminase